MTAYNRQNPIIVKGGYLVRTATLNGGVLSLTGDLNSTTSFEVIAPIANSKTLTFNGLLLPTSRTAYGTIIAQKSVVFPSVALPNVSLLTWVSVHALVHIIDAVTQDTESSPPI